MEQEYTYDESQLDAGLKKLASIMAESDTTANELLNNIQILLEWQEQTGIEDLRTVLYMNNGEPITSDMVRAVERVFEEEY